MLRRTLSNKSRAIKTPVPIRLVLRVLGARKVRNARASRRKVGVPDRARWIGKPKTGNAVHRKASASSKLPVVEKEAVGVDAAVGDAAADAGVKRSQRRWWLLSVRAIQNGC